MERQEPPPLLVEETTPLVEAPSSLEPLRLPEALRGYWVGPYVDPHDPTIRHDAHRITRLEASAQWNLRPTGVTAVPLGPVVAVADPAAQTAQLSGEMESKIAEANQLMATLLERLAAQEAALAALQARLSALED